MCNSEHDLEYYGNEGYADIWTCRKCPHVEYQYIDCGSGG